MPSEYLKQLALEKDIRADAHRKWVSQREQYETETQPGLFKWLGYLGTLYNVPANAYWNKIIAPKYGLEKKPYLSSTTDLSDILETENPSLAYNPAFQKWRIPMDLAGAIFLDPATYASYGWSKIGLASKALQNFERVVGKGGRIAYRLKTAMKIGDKVVDAGTLLDKANMPKLYRMVDSLGGFTKAIPTLPATTAEQIEQGLYGFRFFGKPRMSKPLSRIVKTSANMQDALMAMPKVKQIVDKVSPWFRSPDDVIKQLQAYDDVHGTRLSQLYRENKLSGNVTRTFLKETKTDVNRFQDAIKKGLERRALKQGYRSADEYIDFLTKNGFDVDEFGLDRITRKDAMLAYQFNLDSARLSATGNVIDDAFTVPRFGDDVARGKKVYAKINKEFFEDFPELVDEISKARKANKARTEDILGAVEGARIIRNTREDYVLGFVRGRLDETLPGVTTRVNRLKRLASTAKGTKRKLRGSSIASLDEFVNKRNFILSKDKAESLGMAYSDADRLVANILTDERLASGNHTLGQIVDYGKRINIQDENTFKRLIAEAIGDKSVSKYGDQSLADFYYSLRETVDAMDDFAVKSKLANDEGIIAQMRKVNTGELFDIKLGPDQIVDFYDMRIPFLEAMSKQQVNKEIKALEFHRELFADGMKHGYADIAIDVPGKKLEVAEGFKSLKGYPTMELPRDFARQVLGDKFHTLPEGTRFYWAMNDDLYKLLANSDYISYLRDPAKALSGSEVQWVFDLHKGMQRVWKETTLFPFPPFHIRNFIDNQIRTALEYNILEHVKGDYLGDLKNAMALLTQEGGFRYNDWKRFKVGGKVLSPLAEAKLPKFEIWTGQKITAKEMMKQINDIGVLGEGISFYGEIASNPTEWLYKTLQQMSGSENIQRFQVYKKLLSPEFAKNVGQHIKTGYRGFMDDMIGLAMHIESLARTQLFLKYVREMPWEDALRRMNMVMIDYGNLAPIEKKLFSRSLIFFIPLNVL